MCPYLFFHINMRISVIYGTLSVSCKRVVSVLSPLASNSCGGSQFFRYTDWRFTDVKRIENRESKDGRHNKDSTRAGCRLFNNECRQWSRQSTIEQIRFWPGAFSFTVFTPTRQVRTYSISFKVRTLKLSLYFPAECMVWLPVVIGSLQKKNTPSRQYQKHFSSIVQNMELVFFSVDVPCTLWAEKRPRASVKITQRCFTAHFKSRK